MSFGQRHADLIVAGGGVTGFAAALAAARLGMKVIIVERYGFLGGMFTAGNMTVLSYHPVGGIGKEIVDALTAQGAAAYCPEDPPNYPILHNASELSTMNVVYDAEAAKILLMDLVRAEKNIQLILHSFITDVIIEKDQVGGIVIVNKSGKQIITGKIVVDATGDADIAAYAGAPFRKGQPGGVLFAMTNLVRLSDVDWPALSEYSKKDPGLDEAIGKGIERGELPFYSPRTREMANYHGHARPELSHLLHEGDALLWGGTVTGVDGTDVDDLTRAEIESRRQFMSEINFLKKNIPGFTKARIQSSGVSVGVRDTRHIIGEKTLTGMDVLDRKKFPDGVAYNIKGAFPANEIPYGCFVPLEKNGLLVCGNGFSAVPGSTNQGLQLGSFNDHKDMSTMWTTGEAAGAAAAVCVQTKKQPREVDVSQVRAILKTQGALISDEKAKELEGKLLPSGKTVGKWYSDSTLEKRAYWKSRGEL